MNLIARGQVSRLACQISFLAGIVTTLAVAAEPRQERTSLDCGASALYILFKVADTPVTFDQINAVLPPRRPDGYSMAELAAAARSLGLTLDGVQFVKGDRPLDRPAIAFLKDATGGHHAVLRPVGTTGKMVQVIDVPSPPWITDYDRLPTIRPWTGRVLLLRDSWPRRLAPFVAASVSLAGLIALIFVRKAPPRLVRPRCDVQ